MNEDNQNTIRAHFIDPKFVENAQNLGKSIERFNDWYSEISESLKIYSGSIERSTKIITANVGGMSDNMSSISGLIREREFTRLDLSNRVKSLRERADEYKSFHFEDLDFFFDARDKVQDVFFPNIEEIASIVEVNLPKFNFAEDFVDSYDLEKYVIGKESYSNRWREFIEAFKKYIYLIVHEYNEIRIMSNLMKSLSKQISFLFNLFKKRLRNLRLVFTKNHSFHFKNLDDYHSANLNLSF